MLKHATAEALSLPLLNIQTAHFLSSETDTDNEIQNMLYTRISWKAVNIQLLRHLFSIPN